MVYLCKNWNYMVYKISHSNGLNITYQIELYDQLRGTTRIHTWASLVFMYINDLCQVSEFCLPLLFADDTHLFITSNHTAEMCAKINNDLKIISEWLCCNKLSLNASKTHYMVFSHRSRNISNLDMRINNTEIERVYNTKFLGVQIDAQLSWQNILSIHVINC